MILLNGRTGIAPRNKTYDALTVLLSKALTGIHNSTIVFPIPDSSNAVKLALESLILRELRH
ncbi:MAG: hypothetical protein AAGB19_07210 [Cyanobacteria bacterium P01_F01_bin.3]